MGYAPTRFTKKHEAIIRVTMTTATARPLRRILGLGFGLALVFGTMMGVGILRLPATVAAALGSPTLIMARLGGRRPVLADGRRVGGGARCHDSGQRRVSRLRAARIRRGSWVRHRLGRLAGLCRHSCLRVGHRGRFSRRPVAARSRTLTCPLNCDPGRFHRHSLARAAVGSSVTTVVSATIGLLLLVLVAGCFLAPAASALRPATLSAPLTAAATLLASVTALRAILTAYDGWYAPIYMAEENTDAVRTLPRAIIGGTLLVVALYLVINLAFLHVLPIPVLAASSLPAADAARLVLPKGGAEFVTLLSLFTMLSLVNNCVLTGPRILYAIGRDGFLSQQNRQREYWRHAAHGARRHERGHPDLDTDGHVRSDHRVVLGVDLGLLCVGLPIGLRVAP